MRQLVPICTSIVWYSTWRPTTVNVKNVVGVLCSPDCWNRHYYGAVMDEHCTRAPPMSRGNNYLPSTSTVSEISSTPPRNTKCFCSNHVSPCLTGHARPHPCPINLHAPAGSFRSGTQIKSVHMQHFLILLTRPHISTSIRSKILFFPLFSSCIIPFERVLFPELFATK
jgi:hypothetical protein